ncbi:MAG: ActS/PrrB/RegB family redox-sensitive histidine kinase [Nitratireductor sp.]
MKQQSIHSHSFASLRLETLVFIRWLAVIGQTIAVLLVYFVLEFQFAILPCLAFIALSAVLNIFLRYKFPANVRWQGLPVLLLLGYDILQLTLLLYLTGGIQNPFAALLVVPVVISAATQRAQNTTALFCWALAAATALVYFHEPLPWFEDVPLVHPIQLKVGIWAALAAMMGFTSVYTFRVADESRKLADALSATELVLQHEQDVSNLDGLSTAAAHELGTPLATISLVSKEMLREIPKDSDLYEDAALLRSQAERCKEILKKISSLSSEADETVSLMSVDLLIEEVCAPHRDFEVALNIESEGTKPQPKLKRNSAILYGLGNIVENAVDFAKSEVNFSATWDDEKLTFIVEDDGKGFSPELLARIGEPFVTTRSAANRETGGGLGLGVFIAKTLLERNGAQIVFSNKKKGANNGARVTIVWQRAQFEPIGA